MEKLQEDMRTCVKSMAGMHHHQVSSFDWNKCCKKSNKLWEMCQKSVQDLSQHYALSHGSDSNEKSQIQMKSFSDSKGVPHQYRRDSTPCWLERGSTVPLHHGQTLLLFHPHRSCLRCRWSGSSHRRLSSEVHVEQELLQWHAAVNCTSILCLITLIKVSRTAFRAGNSVSTLVSRMYTLNVFPMELLSNIFIQIIFIVFIYWYLFKLARIFVFISMFFVCKINTMLTIKNMTYIIIICVLVSVFSLWRLFLIWEIIPH